MSAPSPERCACLVRDVCEGLLILGCVSAIALAAMVWLPFLADHIR